MLVLGSLFLAFLLAGFPNDRPSLTLIVPAMFALPGDLGYAALSCGLIGASIMEP